MARGNFDSLVVNVRLDRKQRALLDALLVPWRRLEERANEFVEWHSFVLWARAIVEVVGHLPDVVRSELLTRCPRFLDANEFAKRQQIWKLLEEWIAKQRFADANAGGWFDAIMYCAYKDLPRASDSTATVVKARF
jgi:hypothetical protein